MVTEAMSDGTDARVSFDLDLALSEISLYREPVPLF